MTTVASEAKAIPSKVRVEHPWKLGFRSLESEIVEARELPVRGTIPRELSGALYRIGPGRLDTYGERLASWFDGDGMVHALAIEDGRVTYKNRFVATPGKLREDGAKKRLYGGFATPGPGGAIRRLLHRNDWKNPANTNVLVHGGKLLALCEGGRPYRLDPETLATLGEDDMSGALAEGALYSAHPKLDRASGEMWNFGMEYGKDAKLNLFRTTKEGLTTRVTTLVLPAAAMVHDFALTATKAIFIIAPIVLPRLPVGLLLGQRSFADSLRYRPELGVQIAIVDRVSGEARWVHTDAFMMFHTSSAWDEGDDVVVDLCAYPDASMMRTIRDVMVGATPTPARAYVERLRIGRAGEVVRTRLSSTALEFPRVAGRKPEAERTKVYGVSWMEGEDFVARPAVIDTRTGKARFASFGPSEFAGECVPVAKRADSTSEDDVWLLTLVLDGAAQTTELRVLDGGDIGAPPVATVRLPHVVPFGFHGNWVGSKRERSN